jgi:hypothetical protein
MAKLSSFRIDAKKVNSGVLCEYADGVKFLVARKPNDAFEQMMEDLVQPHLASIRAGTFDKKLDQQITKEAVAKTVLLGWENLTDDEGQPIPYTPEKALEILNDPAYADIYRFILTMASSQQLFRVKEQERAEKNL